MHAGEQSGTGDSEHYFSFTLYSEGGMNAIKEGVEEIFTK